MRDRDRWWWLALLAGLVCFVAGVWVSCILVLSIPAGDLFAAGAGRRTSFDGYAWLALGYLGGGVAFLVTALRGRASHLRRLAALRGDEEAVPLARVRVYPESAPDVTEQPLEILWQASTRHKVVQIPLVCACIYWIGTLLHYVFSPGFLSPQPAYPPLHTSPQSMSVLTIALWVVIAAMLLTMAVAVVAGIVYGICSIPLIFGRRFGVIATNLGMDASTVVGSRTSMAWSEMRLLELRRASTTMRRYSLYAPGKCISWTQSIGGRSGTAYVPVGATASEQSQREAELLSIISARAGLAPRTLSKMQQSNPAPTPGPRRESSFGAFLFIVLLLVGITGAHILFPVTPFRWVNWASVGSLALLTSALLVSRLRSAHADSTVASHVTPPTAVAPSLDAPGVSYALSWSVPLLARLVLAFIGVCLTVNLIPCGWVLQRDESVSPGTFALGCALGALGLIGVVLAFYAAASGTTRIKADSGGLTRYRGRRRRSILWSSVEDISWRGGRTGKIFYVVKGEEPTSVITWPAGPPEASAGQLAEGSMLIGEDELAALVAARSGRHIHMRT